MKLPKKKKLFLPTIFLYFVPPQPPAGSRTGGQTSKKLP